MRKSNLIKLFGDRYYVIENNGGYRVYDKERKAKRSNFLFIGKFYLSTDNKHYVFNEDRYDSVESLIGAMDAYNAKLPFSSENYDPLYRKHILIEFCIDDYLKGLGFECNWMEGHGFVSVYRLKDAYGETICKLRIKTNEDTTSGIVFRDIFNDKWQEASFTDLDSAIGACNSLLAAYCALLDARMMNLLNKMTNDRAGEVLYKSFDIRTLNTFVEDAKEKTIEYLEAEMKRLKGE